MKRNRHTANKGGRPFGGLSHTVSLTSQAMLCHLRNHPVEPLYFGGVKSVKNLHG
ncbi:MAG TPA: hypothetical protein VFQ47_02710 [Nitrososphaera sp.]|nr:hypothetical protein [Nitrososphaera sp.]